MRREVAASFIAAGVSHSLLLFGIHLGAPAKQLALSDDPSPMDVNLVAAIPKTPSESTPDETETTPEPVAPPSEPPAAIPPPDSIIPEPSPDAALPAPAPEPTPVPREATALPTEQPRRNPRPRFSLPHVSEKSAAHPYSTITGIAESGNATADRASFSSRPRYLSNPKPEYPADSRKQHQEGVVFLIVNVTADGRASDVVLKRSSGFSLLDQAAIQGVRRWTFQPATISGLPVSSRLEVPVRFNLSN